MVMVVQMSGAYPFERPEDKHDTQKLAKMIQASLSGFQKKYQNFQVENIQYFWTFYVIS